MQLHQCRWEGFSSSATVESDDGLGITATAKVGCTSVLPFTIMLQGKSVCRDLHAMLRPARLHSD